MIIQRYPDEFPEYGSTYCMVYNDKTTNINVTGGATPGENGSRPCIGGVPLFVGAKFWRVLDLPKDGQFIHYKANYEGAIISGGGWAYKGGIYAAKYGDGKYYVWVVNAKDLISWNGEVISEVS